MMTEPERAELSRLVERYGVGEVVRIVAGTPREGAPEQPAADAAAAAEVVSCSFCGRVRGRVAHMVSGKDAHICDRCVEMSSGIIAMESGGD